MKKLPVLFTTLACLSLVSCGSTDGRTGAEGYKSYGEKVDDTKIISSIKRIYLNDPLIRDSLIHIAIDRGIVQLSGFVPARDEADLAVSKARATAGVKDVINNIVVLSSVEYANIRAAAEKHDTAR
jgi:osmotically-inducible protein OsmY